MPDLDTRLAELFGRMEASAFVPPPAAAPRESSVAPRGEPAMPRPRRTKRRIWVIALAGAAFVVVGASLATAGGLLDLRDPGTKDAAFPSEITCRTGTTVCSPGRAADGRVFKLSKIGESAEGVAVVGAGADAGDGTPVTPLICAATAGGLQCPPQDPEGEKLFGVYLPE